MTYGWPRTAPLCLALMAIASSAGAQPAATDGASVKELNQRLLKQEERSNRTNEELRQLRASLEELRLQNVKIKQSDRQLDDVRAGQTPAATLPSAPVGEKPADERTIQEVTALPEGMNVLSAPGTFIFTPSTEYTRSSSNRLVFRGVEIVPGIQLGLVDANQVASDNAVAAADVRVGILPGVEAEVRIPYVYRHESLTTVQQQVTSGTAPVSQTQNLTGSTIGDVELLGRYQVNNPSGEEPIYIASLRVKSDSGLGPFDVNFDSSGVATSLPTGTGFWAAGPGLTVIIPSDPAVLFGTVGYLHTFGGDVNKTIGTTHVGDVQPGDAINLGLGFGFALNPRFSFSLGYSHSMILPSSTMLGTTTQRSNTLQAGSLTMGWSYQFSRSFVLNNNFEFGVTSDAPSLLITFRVPLTL